ncbi:hypothetical protein TNCV_2247831 [Trichonephila clavipes]|nr:hypothetical protein TNCV_2247831 [Trichonephila clavipes]
MLYDEVDPSGLYTKLHKPATRGLLATDHVILNLGQVTGTTPELAPPLLTTNHTNGRTFQHSTDLTCIVPYTAGLKWHWARTRDKASHGPIPIPIGFRGHP